MDRLSWKTVLKGISIDDATIQENYFRRATAIFFKINGELPSVISISGERTRFDLDKALLTIKEEFKLNEDRFISIQEYIVATKENRVDQTLFLIDKSLLLSFDFTFNFGFTIHYCNTTDQKLIYKIKSLLERCKREVQPNYTHFLIETSGRLTLRAFKNVAQPDDIVQTNYNDDFLEVDRIIKEKLEQSGSRGLVLLHGMPGTGKSSYIRYLISVLKKRVIYMPPDMIHIISSPEFISFIADYPDSVIVMEDSEDIIQQRSGGKGTAISNILNLTDGIIGDYLKVQILCTFNSPLASVDAALLRPGRLLIKYEFTELEEKKCDKILKKLGISAAVSKKMTLAEVYNYKEINDSNYKSGMERRLIGFNNSSK